MLANGRNVQSSNLALSCLHPSAFSPVTSLLVVKQATSLATVSCCQSPSSHLYSDPTSLTSTCISLPMNYPRPCSPILLEMMALSTLGAHPSSLLLLRKLTHKQSSSFVLGR